MYYFKTLIFVQYLSVTIVDKLESRMKEIWRMSEISVLRHYSRASKVCNKVYSGWPSEICCLT